MIQCIRCGRESSRIRRGYCGSCYQTLRNNGVLHKIEKPILPNSLNKYQIEVLTGLMLGDGNIFRGKNASWPKLSVDRAIEDKQYLIENYDTFKDFCLSPPHYYERHRWGKVYEGGAFATRQAKVFDSWYEIWYPNNVKCVPRSLVLSPIAIAIWFCDDGSIRPREHNVARMELQLATQGFSKDDNEFLCSLLTDKFKEPFLVCKSDKLYKIIAADNATRAFIQEIDPIFPQSMLRKACWKNTETRFYENIPPMVRSGQKVSYKLSTKDIIEINRLRPNMSITELSNKFGVSRTHIHRITSQNYVGFNK
jgi:hypothetical protein